MPKSDFESLFDRFNQIAVGFGPMFRDFEHVSNNYPPFNVVNVSDTEVRLELALAGFRKDEITIQEENGTLTIGTIPDLAKTEESYQYRGIAKRSFKRKFHIAEFYEISGAAFENGILSISFVKNIPEAAKPKLIAIR